MTQGTLVVLHVLSAVIGFGAIFVTGVFAGLARRRTDDAVRRYFRPGRNWAARALYAVPVLGVALVATSHGTDRFAQVWVWVSLLLWAAAAAVAQLVVWPGEARIQRLVAEAGPGGRPTEVGSGASAHESAAGASELERACRRVTRAATAMGAVFVATLVLMVARPGGGG